MGGEVKVQKRSTGTVLFCLPIREVIGELQVFHPLDPAFLASSSLDLTPVYAVFYFKILHFTWVENFLLSLYGLMRIYTKNLLPVFYNSACSK